MFSVGTAFVLWFKTNPLPGKTNLNSSKLKASVDNYQVLNVSQTMAFVSDRVENRVGKVQNADEQHVVLLHGVFIPSFTGPLKLGVV